MEIIRWYSEFDADHELSIYVDNQEKKRYTLERAGLKTYVYRR